MGGAGFTVFRRLWIVAPNGPQGWVPTGRHLPHSSWLQVLIDWRFILSIASQDTSGTS
jgi:hypothetical protein